MSVVISGATRRTGAAAAAAFLKQVMMFVSSFAQMTAGREDRGAEAVIADFTDGPAMKTAMRARAAPI